MLRSASIAMLVTACTATPAWPQSGSERLPANCRPEPTARHMPSCARPKMRYWLPLGQIDAQAVRHDVARIAEAGFGGIEINSMPASQPPSAAQSFGGPDWLNALRAALSEARKSGIGIDLAVGPFYPAAVPQAHVGEGASRELVFTAARVDERFSGQLPVPQGGSGARLVGVSAVRIEASHLTSAIADRASLIDLTAAVIDNGLTWSPPGEGQWRIIVSWSRETGHQIAGAAFAPYVVVDHFSLDGTQKIIASWKSDLLPQLGADRAALQDVFEDSLHLQGYTLWTEDLLSQFRRRRGYDLRPYLPVISIGHLNDFFFAISNRRDVTPRSAPDYDFSDGSGTAIRDDYYQTLTELYQERHLAPLRTFFASQGMNLRVQTAYGQSLEGTSPVELVDVPETESFQLDDHVEAYRVQAGAAHVLGKPVYSAECCATRGAAGKTDWNDAMTHIGGLFAGGVNQIVFHGYAQTTKHKLGEAGWSPFGGAFSENYGAIAAWSQAPRVTAKLARQQAILRAGKPELDIALLRHSYWDSGHGKFSPGFDYWADGGLESAGYTHDYVSPALLSVRQWTPDRRLAAPNGPAYRAVLVMPRQALPVSALDRLQATAEAGVPIVFVGTAPTASGLNANSAAFAHKLTKILAMSNVRTVAQPDQAVAALVSLGIAPRVEKVEATNIQVVIRRTRSGRYLWLHNPAASAISQTLRAPAGHVFEVDLQSGRMIKFSASGGAADRSWVFTMRPGEVRAFFLAN